MAHDTGERKVLGEKFSPLFADVFERKEHVEHVHTTEFEVGKKYRIGVTLGAQVFVSEFDTFQNKDAIALAVERTKRSIVEAVFGEFREDMMRLQNAIYDRDFQTSRTLLTNLEQKMFGID